MPQDKKTGSRPQRFSLRLPVQYRMAGETEWHSATTENLSSGGALIASEASTVPATSLEVVISLPPTGFDLGGFLVGRGRVLRSSSPTSPTGVSRFAIGVTRYRLSRLEQITDMIEHWNPLKTS